MTEEADWHITEGMIDWDSHWWKLAYLSPAFRGVWMEAFLVNILKVPTATEIFKPGLVPEKNN